MLDELAGGELADLARTDDHGALGVSGMAPNHGADRGSPRRDQDSRGCPEDHDAFRVRVPRQCPAREEAAPRAGGEQLRQGDELAEGGMPRPTVVQLVQAARAGYGDP